MLGVCQGRLHLQSLLLTLNKSKMCTEEPVKAVQCGCNSCCRASKSMVTAAMHAVCRHAQEEAPDLTVLWVFG